MIISIGGLVLSFELESLMWRPDYDKTVDSDTIIVFSIVIVSILIGVGLIVKLNWARHLLAIILTGFLLLIGVIFISELSSMSRNVIPSNIAGAIVVVTIYFFFIFLLYNRKVAEEFGVKHQEKDLEDILDFQE